MRVFFPLGLKSHVSDIKINSQDSVKCYCTDTGLSHTLALFQILLKENLSTVRFVRGGHAQGISVTGDWVTVTHD